MQFHVTIINPVATERAFDEDRRPREGEGKRDLRVECRSMSGINFRVQEIMCAAGFERNEWKVLDWKPCVGLCFP